MAVATDAFWVGHFCVELGDFVSNRAHLCRTKHLFVQLDTLASNEFYDTYPYPKFNGNLRGIGAIRFHRKLLCPLLLTWFNFNPSMDK